MWRFWVVKGLSNKAIAEMRACGEGTIKAHSNAIYRKAGVSGRHELMSIFLDELLQASLVTWPEAAQRTKH